MRKKEKETQRICNFIKNSTANGAGIAEKNISVTKSLELDPDLQKQGKFAENLSKMGNTADGVDFAGRPGPMEAEPVTSKISTRSKS